MRLSIFSRRRIWLVYRNKNDVRFRLDKRLIIYLYGLQYFSNNKQQIEIASHLIHSWEFRNAHTLSQARSHTY